LAVYRRILAPLDGSALAEATLEHVVAVAAGCRVPEVVLLVVLEPVSSLAFPSQAALDKDLIARMEQNSQTHAQGYIAKMVDRLRKDSVAARGVVVWGVAADEIVDYARKNQVDLIIMSTHGRSGVSRWAFGSVADKVMRRSPVPVLVIPPDSSGHGGL